MKLKPTAILGEEVVKIIYKNDDGNKYYIKITKTFTRAGYAPRNLYTSQSSRVVKVPTGNQRDKRKGKIS